MQAYLRASTEISPVLLHSQDLIYDFVQLVVDRVDGVMRLLYIKHF